DGRDDAHSGDDHPSHLSPRRIVSLWSLRSPVARTLSFACLRGRVVDKCDFEVERLEDHRAVGGKPAVGDAKDKPGPHHSFDVDAVYDFLHGRKHLAAEPDLAHAERTALARRPEPTQEEAEHLPQRIEPEAPRHHRIPLEMAREEPEIGLELEDGAHQPPAVFTAHFGNLRNMVEHQHRRQRQLRTFGKQLATPAGEQILIVEMRTPFLHPPSLRPQLNAPPIPNFALPERYPWKAHSG